MSIQQLQQGTKRGHPSHGWNPIDLSAKRKSRGYLDSHKDVEKRRRDRINNYLDTIRSLLPIYDNLPKQKRLDKADVLDMTVVYLQMVNAFLENLGVKDIFCAVHQQLSLLNATEEWIQSHHSQFSSVPSFVEAFSKHIKTEHKCAYKVIATAIEVEENSRPRFTEPSLPPGSARACCTELDAASSGTGIVYGADMGKQVTKIKHSPFVRSLLEITSTPEVTNSDITNGHVGAMEHSMESEVHIPPVATSRFQTPNANVGLVELLQRKVRPEIQQQGTHQSLPHSSNQEYWVSDENEGWTEFSDIEQSHHGRASVGYSTPNVQNSQSVQHHQGLDSTAGYPGRTRPAPSPESSWSQSANNQSVLTVFDSLPTSVQHGGNDPNASGLQEETTNHSSSQGYGNATRKKCHCELKVHVRDQGMNTDKVNSLLEKEVILKVDAGRIELDIGSLLRKVQATDDRCIVPISFEGSVSLNATNTEATISAEGDNLDRETIIKVEGS